MDNLKRKENIVSIYEEIIDVNYKMAGAIFKKEVAEESLYKKIIYYLSNGLLIKAEEYLISTNHKYIKEYSNGKIVSEINFDKFSCLCYEIIFKYDINGNKILHDMKFPKSKTYTTEFLNYYNNELQLIKRESYTNAIFDYAEDICYDSKKNVSLIWRKNTDNIELYKVNNYYNYFNQLYKSVGIDNKNQKRIRFEYLYEYNSNGDISVYTKIENGNNQVTKYEYKLDYNSNWIEKKEIKENKILKIHKRSIKYN